MEIYDHSVCEKARQLYSTGLSYRKTGEILGISEGTVRRWCTDLNGEDRKIILRNDKRRNDIKANELKSFSINKIDNQHARMLAAMLYWAEGTKYPHSNSVSFSNSDPMMVKFFIKLLRTAYMIEESKFRVHLQIHSNQDQSELFNYWSKLLDIPTSRFWKPTVTHPTNKMKRRDYLGTCTLRYHDCKILLKLTAIYEYFSSGEVAEWPIAASC